MKKLLSLVCVLLITVCAMAANTVTKVEMTITNTITASGDIDYVITAATPFSGRGKINITNTNHAVVIFQNIKPSVVISKWLTYIQINGAAARNNSNCQVKMYGAGTIIMPYASTIKPLTCYSGQNFSGTSYTSYGTGNNGGYMNTLTTTNGLNNIRSFKLKRGYMVTFATGTAGWGYSRCFIADTEDLEIATLPAVFDGKISSYRIFQWFDAQKKGVSGSSGTDVTGPTNSSWSFSWGILGSQAPDVEAVPHKLHKNWPSVAEVGNTSTSPHAKTDNEPANSADDTPGTVEEVLGYWEDLMRTGLRLCSPSSHDGGYTWQDNFMREIDARGWRCDILDIHCYWPSGSFSSIKSRFWDKYHRPIWISELMWGASWNNDGIFSSAPDGPGSGSAANQTALYNGAKGIIDALNSYDYVERYAWWNGENTASKIYNNGLTTFGTYYANTYSGMAYKKANEFVPIVVLKSPYDFDGTISGNSVQLSWKDRNGDMMDEIRVQYKKTSDANWTTLATVNRKDKTSNADQSYTYSGALTDAEQYCYRVVDIFDGKEYSSPVMLSSVEEGYMNFLPSNLNDYYFMFYSKEATTDLVWAVSGDQVQYQTPAAKTGTNLNQLWTIEDNSANGGFSLRNLGTPDYLICSPNSWDFVTNNTTYKVAAAKTSYLPEFTDDYCVMRNVAHNTYVGLWDADKKFGAGERLAGNRTNYTGGNDSGDKILVYAIPRSTINDIINNSASSNWTAGGTYYLYNIEAGQFACSGNSWGTQASLGNNGIDWTLEQSGSLYRLKNNTNSKHLFVASNTEMYVDGDDTRLREFSLTQDPLTGVTYISVNPDNADYGTAALGTTYVGWDGENNTIIRPVLKKSNEATGIKWQLMNSLTYTMYHDIINDAYEARRTMYANVKQAAATGKGAKQIAIFENPGSTAEQLEEANATLAGILNGTIEEDEEQEETEIIDVTDDYLQNPKFDEGDMMAVNIHTYQKDIVGSNVAQMQPVEGWTIASNGDARSGGQYAMNSGLFLGGTGYNVPGTNSESSIDGGALGIVGVWTGVAQYTQNVTLPAGTYTISFVLDNVGGAQAITKNLFGFIADNGVEYLCNDLTFATNRWTTIKTTFILTEETSGKISVGYASANTGSGNMPHLFVDYVNITTEQQKEIKPELIEITKPELPAIDITSWSGGTTTPVYIYNVESDAFVTYGMNWNTNSIATRLSNGDQTASARHNNYVTYNGGVLNIISANFNNRFIGTNSGTNDVWADFTANKDWAIIDRGDNTYGIAFGSATGNLLDVSYNNGGHLTINNGVGNTTWAFINTTDVTNGKYAIYKAKKNIYALYSALQTAGLADKYLTDINNAAIIYNSPAANSSAINNAAKTLAMAVAEDMPSGLDVSYLFTNADILANNGQASWTTTTMAYGNADLEVYHAPFKMEQTQTGMPTGMYTVAMHALVRLDNGDPAPQLSVKGEQNLSADIPEMKSLDWGCNTNGGNNWTTADNGKVVPNGMLSCGQALTYQNAAAVVDGVPVDNGQLTISMNVTSGNQWFNTQGFTITYTSISDYLAKVRAAAEGCLIIYNGKLAAGIVSELNTAIATTLAGTSSANEAYLLGQTVQSLIDQAKETYGAYVKLQDLIALVEVYDGDNKDTLTDPIASAHGTLATGITAAELNQAYDTLYELYRNAILTQRADGADLTALIVNPEIISNDEGKIPEGWTGNSAGWRWTVGTGNTFMESWVGTAAGLIFDMHQTINGLKDGVYELSVDMKNSTNGEEGAQFEGGECGLYAECGTEKAFVGVTTDSDDMSTYKLLIYVTEGEPLTIGVKNVTTATARWFACDNFRLTLRFAEGDANSDLNVTISDAARMINIMQGNEGYRRAADINADGKVDDADLLLLRNKLLRK